MSNSNKSVDNNSILVKKLQQASEGLLFLSESEYPFEVFVWKTEGQQDINRELIVKKTENSFNTPIEFVDLDSFFEVATTEQDWHGSAEKEIVKRYQQLSKVLKQCLTELQVVRLGTTAIDVYIIGKTPSGDLAGLSTKVVET